MNKKKETKNKKTKHILNGSKNKNKKITEYISN